MYSLAAALRDGRDGAVSMTHAPIFFAVAEQRPDAFEPSYEWQEVAQGQSVASGLDVRCHAMLPAPLLPAPLPHASPPAAVRRREGARVTPCCAAAVQVRLSLDGSHKTLARILPTWRLQARCSCGRAGGRAGGRVGGWESGGAYQ
jgi:hypothetical protein